MSDLPNLSILEQPPSAKLGSPFGKMATQEAGHHGVVVEVRGSGLRSVAAEVGEHYLTESDVRQFAAC